MKPKTRQPVGPETLRRLAGHGTQSPGEAGEAFSSAATAMRRREGGERSLQLHSTPTVETPGPVLLYLAEDSLQSARARVEGISTASRAHSGRNSPYPNPTKAYGFMG
jgi:hypothetical protein